MQTSTKTKPVGNDGELLEEVMRLGDMVRDMARDTAGDAQAYMQQRTAAVEEMVRRNPTQAVLIAGGVGFVLGLMLMRR